MDVTVYEVKGTAYERGLQEGKNRAEEIACTVNGLLGNKMVVDALGQGDAGKALLRAERLFHERLRDVPDLTIYPELHGAGQQIEEEARGLAEGASVPFSHVALYRQASYLADTMVGRSIGPTFSDRSFSRGQPFSQGCTAIAFSESPEGPIVGYDAAGMIPPPSWKYGLPVVRPDAGYATIRGMNEAGLALLALNCWVFKDETSPQTFPADVHQMVLRHCSSADAALEMLTRYSPFWGPCLLLVADAQGQAALVEKSGCRYGVRRAEAGAVFSTEGVMLHPEMAPFLEAGRGRHLVEEGLSEYSADFRYFRDTKVRFDNLARVVKEKEGCYSVSAMKDVLCDHSPFPHGVCRHGGPDGSPNDGTISLVKSIALLRERKWLVAVYRDGVFPCQREYVEVSF